jgi:DNA-binding ferritin-like protein (Dps family)
MIYPLIKDNSLIHASFNKYENHCKLFPISYCNEYKFVGEYVYHDESRSIRHIDILKNAIIK